MRIGVMTGGGDCPGLNAAIRAVTCTATEQHGFEVTGIRDGAVAGGGYNLGGGRPARAGGRNGSIDGGSARRARIAGGPPFTAGCARNERVRWLS